MYSKIARQWAERKLIFIGGKRYFDPRSQFAFEGSTNVLDEYLTERGILFQWALEGMYRCAIAWSMELNIKIPEQYVWIPDTLTPARWDNFIFYEDHPFIELRSTVVKYYLMWEQQELMANMKRHDEIKISLKNEGFPFGALITLPEAAARYARFQDIINCFEKEKAK